MGSGKTTRVFHAHLPDGILVEYPIRPPNFMLNYPRLPTREAGARLHETLYVVGDGDR